jgi:hypothetical protein
MPSWCRSTLGYRFVIRPPKIFLTLAAISVVVLGLAASPAMAKKPAKKAACWKILVNDWYDGTVDGKYALRCYRDALRHLKGETYAVGYTSAYDDINRAYQQRRQEIAGRDVGPYQSRGDSIVSPTGRPPTGRGPGSGPNFVAPDRWYPPASEPVQRTDDQSPVGDLIQTLGPNDATSIPIPLMILAGIALLLMAAGAVSLIARRAQGRRATVPVQPAPPARGR